MSSWHKKVTQSLADSVSAVLNDMKEDQKASQNKMMKKGKGEPAGQIKPKQALPEEDEEENGNGNGKKKKLDPVNKKALKKDFASRAKAGDADIDNDGDEDESDKFLHKKRQAISKAIRNTSAKSKKVDLSKKKEKVKVNPTMGESVDFSDDRQQLRETLEASIDTVFQYSNKEEEAFRAQWMTEFDSQVASIDPQAYIDPLQRKVLYIEGLTSSQAANRYLAHCVANASMAGGEYSKGGTRGGDDNAVKQHSGQEVGRVHHPRHQVKH
jgi:hypothetical protein